MKSQVRSYCSSGLVEPAFQAVLLSDDPCGLRKTQDYRVGEHARLTCNLTKANAKIIVASAQPDRAKAQWVECQRLRKLGQASDRDTTFPGFRSLHFMKWQTCLASNRRSLDTHGLPPMPQHGGCLATLSHDGDHIVFRQFGKLRPTERFKGFKGSQRCPLCFITPPRNVGLAAHEHPIRSARNFREGLSALRRRPENLYDPRIGVSFRTPNQSHSHSRSSSPTTIRAGRPTSSSYFIQPTLYPQLFMASPASRSCRSLFGPYLPEAPLMIISSSARNQSSPPQ